MLQTPTRWTVSFNKAVFHKNKKLLIFLINIPGMFGPSTAFSTATPFGQPSSFNYFHSNGDYSTWGNQLGQRKQYDDYYRETQNMYHTMPESALKGVEQAMQNLGMSRE